MEKGVKIDAHPAFVQLLIYYLVKLFGYVTWIIKLPFLVVSLGAILYAYAFGLRNFSKQVALLNAVVFSFSFIFVFYAPIARMYISGVFFSMALLYYFFEIFFLKNTRTVNYFFLGLFALLSALNQHINALFAFTVCVSGFLFLNKTNYKAYLGMCILVVLAYLPHLSTTLYQLSVPGIGRDNGGWLEAPEFKVLFSFVATLFGTGKTYLLFLFLTLLAFILNRKALITKKQIYLLLIFFINFLVVYFYSIWRSPIFQYSVMLFSATALLVFVCSFIEFKNNKVFYPVLVLLTLVLLYQSYVRKDYFRESVKTVYEYQFERTAFYKNLLGDKNVYPVFFDADNIMKKIYFEKYRTNFACKISSDSIISNMERVYFKREKDPVTGESYPGGEVSSLRLFSEFIGGLKCDYLVLTSAMPHYQAIVKEHFPHLLENTQTQAINFKLYSKRPEDRFRTVEDDKVNVYSTISQPAGFDYLKANKVQLNNNSFSLKVDSLNEFPFDAKALLNEVTYKEGQVILVTTRARLKNKNSLLETCISVIDKTSNGQYAYNAKAASDFLPSKDSVVTIYSEHFNGVKYNQVKNKSYVNCYLWNRGKENFELREFEIRVIDYWPRKWDLWD